MNEPDNIIPKTDTGRVYNRRVKATIKCNNSSVIVVQAKLQIKANSFTEAETKIKEQFYQWLVSSLATGIKVENLLLS